MRSAVFAVVVLAAASPAVDPPVARKYWVCVSNEASGDVTPIDGADHTVVATVAAGKRPWGVAVSPDGSRLCVANGPSDDVSVVDTEAAKEVARVSAGRGPWGVAVVPAPSD